MKTSAATMTGILTKLRKSGMKPATKKKKTHGRIWCFRV